ncbi:MAG: 5-formyltetrahydrofolate cyclo-ligase [Balneolales bacterium]
MKADLRKLLLQKRLKLSNSEISAISKKIIKKVLGLEEYRLAKTIHCYLSLDNEISTTLLIDDLLAQGKNLVVPRVVAGTNRLEHVALESRDQLIPNAWGIPEPRDGRLVQPGQLDLVIVPMVGGDPECNRLGYGKGFYDQFLAGVNAIKIGLMPHCCLVEKLPVEPHDVKLDRIVTESKIYKKNT